MMSPSNGNRQMVQFERLRALSSEAIRQKVLFKDRPTKYDIQKAEDFDTFIVARAHFSERLRERVLKLCPMAQAGMAFRQVDMVLGEIGIPKGHPRVFVFCDTCDTYEKFQAKALAKLAGVRA